MKTMNILLTAFIALSYVQGANAASAKKAPAKQINASEDIDSLGGNKDLMVMAGNIQSTSRSRIVQNESLIATTLWNSVYLTEVFSVGMLTFAHKALVLQLTGISLLVGL